MIGLSLVPILTSFMVLRFWWNGYLPDPELNIYPFVFLFTIWMLLFKLRLAPLLWCILRLAACLESLGELVISVSNRFLKLLRSSIENPNWLCFGYFLFLGTIGLRGIKVLVRASLLLARLAIRALVVFMVPCKLLRIYFSYYSNCLILFSCASFYIIDYLASYSQLVLTLYKCP